MGSYNDLRRLTRDTRLEVHHIIEVRIILGNKVIRGKIPSVRKAPAVIVTHDQHVSITNSLISNLPYGSSYSKMSIGEIQRYYSGVYGAFDHDDWISNIFH